MEEQDKKRYCFDAAKELVQNGLVSYEDIFAESDKIYAHVFGTKEP